MYRKDARKRRLTLGNYPALSLKPWRVRPPTKHCAPLSVATTRRASAAPSPAAPLTFEGFARAYLERYCETPQKELAGRPGDDRE